MNPEETGLSAREAAWHSQPTMWIVLGVLAFTVLSSIVLLYLAATNPPELIDKIPTAVESPVDNRTSD